MDALIFATIAYAIVHMRVQRTIQSTGYILNQLSIETFDRNDPQHIDNEVVWSKVSAEWSRMASIKSMTIAFAASTICFLLLSQVDAKLAFNWPRHIVSCRLGLLVDPNQQPLVLELINEKSPFVHNVQQPMLNLDKLPKDNQNNLDQFHSIYCYPDRMYLSQDLLIKFEQCLKSKQMTWTDLLATVTVDNQLFLATAAVATAASNLVLILFRVIVDLDVWQRFF